MPVYTILFAFISVGADVVKAVITHFTASTPAPCVPTEGCVTPNGVHWKLIKP